jgi:hypothetical protein
MRLFALSLALTLAAGGAAFAQGSGTSLKLKTADNAPAKVIIDGATWKCAQGVCMASGGTNGQAASRACRRVVAKLGPVEAFTWRGQVFTADELAACNGAARMAG